MKLLDPGPLDDVDLSKEKNTIETWLLIVCCAKISEYLKIQNKSTGRPLRSQYQINRFIIYRMFFEQINQIWKTHVDVKWWWPDACTTAITFAGRRTVANVSLKYTPSLKTFAFDF